MLRRRNRSRLLRSQDHPGGRRLGLSVDQKTALAKIRADYAQRIEVPWKLVQQKHSELRTLWTSGEVPTKEAVVKLQGEMRGHRMIVADAAVDARIAALKVLTADQRKSIGRGWGAGRGRGRGAGPPGP